MTRCFSKYPRFHLFRTLSFIQVCALAVFVSGVRGQEKPLQPEMANTNSGAPIGADQNTNAPGSLVGGTAATQLPASLRPFQLVLPRDHLFGDWFGLRSKAQDSGIS